VLIEREQNDEYKLYGSKLEACIFMVNKDQAFEEGFQ
jgi:hypothetical protein